MLVFRLLRGCDWLKRILEILLGLGSPLYTFVVSCPMFVWICHLIVRIGGWLKYPVSFLYFWPRWL